MAANRTAVFINLFLIVIFTMAQSSDPDQRLTIVFENDSIITALARLNEVSTRQLSYNPQVLPNDLVIDQSFESESDERILTQILGPDYQIKEVGNYLVIQKIPPSKKEKNTFQIKGGIKDASTGETLKDVSIFEINSLQSTLSTEQGSFSLEAETGFAEATFVISKRFYQDTIIRVRSPEVLSSPITLKQEPEAANWISVRERVRTFSSGISKFFTSSEVRRNARNVNFVDTRIFQLSLVPSIGTNRKLSSQIRNRLSINLLAGYGYGVRGVELGGVYNTDREEVRGLQVGGFGNTVGGEVRGVQLAGFINTSKDYVDGVQIGGFLNVASDSVMGFQAAGFTNVTRQMSGFQVSGFSSHTSRMSGWQLSGFMNTTRELDGFQLAGFINVSHMVRGFQFGVINIADSVASGVPFGLVNVVRKNGFISPAVESDDISPYQLSFRSGMNKLYTVLFAGRNPNDFWSFGVGFGSRFFVLKKETLFINPELRWLTLTGEESENDENNQVVRLNLNLGYQLFRRLSITAGPSLGFYWTNSLNESGDPLLDIANNPLLDESASGYRYQLWVGYSMGIGF